MPRATTAACEVLPPRLVRMPCAAKKPWMSSGLVSSRTQDDLDALLAERLRAVGVEDGLAASGAGRGGQAGRQRLPLVLRIEPREQHLLEVRGIDAQERFARAADQAFVVHLDRGAHHRGRVHLAVARLQAVERSALDRELEVLHFAVVTLEPVAQVEQLPVHLRHLAFHLRDRFRRANASDHVLALRVDEVFAVDQVLARRGVAREADAGRAVVAHVAEHHRARR